MAECRPWDSGECEHGWVPPKDARCRDWRHCHCSHLDVGTGLIGVDLQEHVADAQGRAVAMGDDDLDRIHVGMIARMHDRRRPIYGVHCAADRVPPSILSIRPVRIESFDHDSGSSPLIPASGTADSGGRRNRATNARDSSPGAKRSRGVGGGRWYGPVLPRVKSAARPCGTSLRLALDPRGPPALGRVRRAGRWPCPPARARHLMSPARRRWGPLGWRVSGLAQWWSGGEQVTDLFNRFVEAESLAGAVVEFGGDCVQIGL